MKHFRTMLVGLGIGLGGVALGSLPGQPTLQADGKRPTIPVAVENTPTVNVGRLPAITGSVSIAGQPVSVNVSTLPPVQLAPGTTVGVTGGNVSFSNTADTPIFVRDKDNAALMPFQTTLCSSSNNCTASGSTFTVPTGRRAVIEYVSTFCAPFIAGTQISVTLILATRVGGVEAIYRLNPGLPDSFDRFIANQQARIYADENTSIVFEGIITPAGTLAACTMVLSGYLVTL